MRLALWTPALSLGPPPALVKEDEGPDPLLGLAPGEILVGFHPGTPGRASAALTRQHGGQGKETLPGIDAPVIRVPPSQAQARAAASRRNPTVLFAAVNGLYQAVDFPTDPLYPQQRQYTNTGQAGGTPDATLVRNVDLTPSKILDDKDGHGTLVAGVAGLVWAGGVCGTNVCVRSRIESRADRMAGTWGLWAAGRLNAHRSVAECPRPRL